MNNRFGVIYMLFLLALQMRYVGKRCFILAFIWAICNKCAKMLNIIIKAIFC